MCVLNIFTLGNGPLAIHQWRACELLPGGTYICTIHVTLGNKTHSDLLLPGAAYTYTITDVYDFVTSRKSVVHFSP